QGDSMQATEGHYSEAIAQDIKALVDQLKIGPFILIGWSLAVPAVVNFAVHFANNNLKGLVLVDGMVGIDSSLPFYKKTVELWTAFQTDREKKTRDFINMIFKKPLSEQFVQKLFNCSIKTPTNTVMTLMLNYILLDYRPLLRKISVPTIIFTVDNYRLEYMKHMQKEIPHAELNIIDDAAHALFIDQPERFNEQLSIFISNLLRNQNKTL
ncbi:MAG: alpha/beta fold hydrolase, partial [Parachlamydiaceae bacterium]